MANRSLKRTPSADASIRVSYSRLIDEGRFEFDYEPPSYRALYRDYLHSPVCFGAPRATYAVPVELAATRNVSGDHSHAAHVPLR